MKFDLDKEKFGEYISSLRKERGLTQRELAEKLFVSDKAISKWERGQSFPDITMLSPLAEELGITVTELINCNKIENDEKMNAKQVDSILEKAINISDEEKELKRKMRFKRFLIYICLVLISALSTVIFYKLNGIGSAPGILTIEILMAVFGAYFMFFVKEKLPSYYDENKISAYSDGILRMNMVGIYFNNKNWPYIIRNCRICFMVIMFALPILSILSSLLFEGKVGDTLIMIYTIASIFGIFIPIYLGAIKHK